MVEEQREKEFLFELEQLYRKYNLIISSPDDFQLSDLGNLIDMDKTTKKIEAAIDRLKEVR